MMQRTLFGLGFRALVLSASVFAAGGGIFSPTHCLAQEVAVKDGQTVAFLGDSITQQGAGSPGGYVRLVASGLEGNGIKVTVVPAGISGHKSNQMLERLEKDVLSKKPDWMTLSCGVNDVWHGERGVPLEDYKANITQIVDKCQAAGVKVMVLTATMISEDPAAPNNQKLVPYNDFLRQLAKEKNCLLADLSADMQTAVAALRAEGKTGNQLTTDGVHMNLRGNLMMATGVLGAFGLDDAGLAKAKAHWADVPGIGEVNVKLPLTLRQHEALSKLAAEKKQSLPQFLAERATEAAAALVPAPSAGQ